MIHWILKSFEELSAAELYKILQLRAEVFVVEQECPYLDCDDKDQLSMHFGAWKEDKLIAYVRILPVGVAYKHEPSIGRVCSSQSVRRTGIGRELMKRAIEQTHSLYGKTPIRIGAQLYLKKFYESFGFVQEGDVYLEDFIDHISMVRN